MRKKCFFIEFNWIAMSMNLQQMQWLYFEFNAWFHVVKRKVSEWVYKYPSVCRPWNFTPVMMFARRVRDVSRRVTRRLFYRLCPICSALFQPNLNNNGKLWIFFRQTTDVNGGQSWRAGEASCFSKWSKWMETNWLRPTPLTHVFAFWVSRSGWQENCYESPINERTEMANWA